MNLIGDNLEVQIIDGKIHLVIDPTQTVARKEEKERTELVASSRGWTGWTRLDGHMLKFSVNVVKTRY